MKKPHVLVVGAGIGGLAATLALLQRGFEVDVYEQAPELKEVGAGVSISANGTAVLFALGLETPLRAASVSANQRELKLWSTGESWSLYRGGPPAEQRYGYPSFTLHRVDLHGMLIEAVQRLKPDAVHLNRRCVALEKADDGATIALEDGGRVSGDVLIGADGIHSRVRHELYGPARARFTGQVAWRGVCPMNGLPASVQKIAQMTWIGPTAHISCYPVRSGALFNFVGQVERDDWQVESWIAEGSIDECLADFAGWHPDVKRMIENNNKLYKWALFIRDPLPQWTSSRVTLLGDACHSMLPYLGQGANSALEDALVLARCLADSAAEPTHALRRYEEARRLRATRIVEASTEMARTFHNPALARLDTAEKYIAEQWHADKVRSRYDWIYGYDASKVPC